MKYQSELIKEIVDKRGHKFPSLHYQSECVEEWIKEVAGAYPKLCDYEGEWLNYIVESPIGEFPYVTLSDVTEATINNVVPYAYKSAILSGNTLVNLSCLKDINMQQNQTVKISTETVKKGTVYTFKFFVSKNNDAQRIRIRFYNGASLGVLSDYNIVDGLNNLKVTTKTEEECIYFSISNLSSEINIQDFIILEGDYTNQDIPYFEGMQSVKMPVLTTTGKNLFPTSTTLTIDRELGNNGEIINGGGLVTKEYIPLTFFEQCVFSSKASWLRIAFYDIDKKFISLNYKGNVKNLIFTPPSGAKFFRVSSGSDGDARTPNELQYQIEKGTIPTTYEPFKSNILTVNEDVTLRSNGDVCDELNLLTGQLTQRIGEDGVVLSQEIVKPVDLNVEDQDGNTLTIIKPIEGTMHLSTDGETIKPTFTGEIPVEAITQNLASFIEE